jgi:HlyD family secretion protein
MTMIILFIFRTTYDMKQAVSARSIFAAACTIMVLLSGCRRSATGDKLEGRPALTVELTSPKTAIWPEEIAVSGRVEAWQESVVSSEVSGYKLDEILVNVGDPVKKGQLLARFNDEGARAKLAEMEAGLETRAAVLTASSDQLARTRRLVDSRAVSEESHKLNEAAVRRDEAELASARARLSAQQLELRYTQVVAPDDGVISSRTATVGTVLTSGSELFRLIRQNRLEWRAEIPVKYAARIEPGQTAIVEIENGRKLQGTVRQLAPAVDPRTLNATCYIDLRDPGPIKAGMFLSGIIRTGESDAVHVPESSLVYRDGYTYVIMVGQDSIAHQIKVVTARRRENFVEIEGAVSESDRLVLSGGSFVNEGDLVKVVETDDKTVSEGGDR